MPPAGTAKSFRPARRATAALLLGVIALACGCAPSSERPDLTPPSTTPSAAPSTVAGAPTIDLRAFKDRVGTAPIRSTVARATSRQVDVYASPGAKSVQRRIGNAADGAPLVFLVAEQRKDWLKVLLPVRPNGSTGWVRASGMRLSQHDYHIVVAIRAHRITVYNRAQVIRHEPVGLGRDQTPTPGGLYYTTQLIRPPNPNGVYGAYAYALSGFSEVLTTFNGGEAFLGIHGTNDPSGLGKDVSHGCIRMSNAGITKLARTLPLGVPVIVVP